MTATGYRLVCVLVASPRGHCRGVRVEGWGWGCFRQLSLSPSCRCLSLSQNDLCGQAGQALLVKNR